MPAPAQLTDLVARFREHLPDYHAGAYNETQLRRDFLDPLFKLLGWDVHNKAGYAEAYREVVHEDKVKVGGMTKAPDYSFRVGGQRKFFLEAKKPSIFIKEDIAPAYQLRRYAWSAGLSLSILSDFEEFAVYDCRTKPAVNDKASKSRLLYFTFEEYESRWDEIVGLFSKEAILKGAFDRYAATAKGKKGTASVDAEILKEIEAWRDLLARHIALRNPGISNNDLNYAVQQTIDRIIFLRICEDRGIEPYGRLQALQNGGATYDRLKQLFRDADDRYNSGLFHFRPEKGRDAPDEITLSLQLDDKPLKDILKDLYYRNSPYEFSVLPADILGQVYEQFLGKVIRLTSAGQAKVEDKPEVKKAGGVYYTPTYIVDYIVRQTIDRVVEGKTPKQIEKIRVLDPACGSGSFLIGAYQYLLDWHLNAYASDDPERHAKGRAPKIRQGANGWRLTTAERKRILLAHIHGVDIDAQAVEVTKLSLLLKVLEGESDDSLASQFPLFRERVLPDLDANIQCGNPHRRSGQRAGVSR
jgi:predicted type IV restriction endonuclease